MAEEQNDRGAKLISWFDAAKALLTMGAGGVILALLILDFGAMRDASQAFLKRAASSTSDIKIMGVVELTLDNQTVSTLLAPFQDAAESAPNVWDRISKLEPEEYARLMDVGLLDNTCEFETPTAQLRRFVALDYTLAEKGLFQITINPATKAKVERQLEVRKSAGDSVAIGRPLSCYDIALSELGYRVKTTLVQYAKRSFDPHANPGKASK